MRTTKWYSNYWRICAYKNAMDVSRKTVKSEKRSKPFMIYGVL
jgi:hypothetical protein